MNERPSLERPSLRDALRNVEDDSSGHEGAGASAITAAMLGIAAVAAVAQPGARFAELEADRQRLADCALADTIEMVARHRARLGRRVCSPSDGRITRQVFDLLRSMGGHEGGSDADPSFL